MPRYSLDPSGRPTGGRRCRLRSATAPATSTPPDTRSTTGTRADAVRSPSRPVANAIVDGIRLTLVLEDGAELAWRHHDPVRLRRMLELVPSKRVAYPRLPCAARRSLLVQLRDRVRRLAGLRPVHAPPRRRDRRSPAARSASWPASGPTARTGSTTRVRLGEDDLGVWVGAPVGTAMSRPGAAFRTDQAQVTLVPHDERVPRDVLRARRHRALRRVRRHHHRPGLVAATRSPPSTSTSTSCAAGPAGSGSTTRTSSPRTGCARLSLRTWSGSR